jgi:hypothetical protein
MAVSLGPLLVLLGIAMLVNFERIDAWQQRRFPDVRSLRRHGGARRSSCSELRWFSWARSSTAVKCGSALDAPDSAIGTTQGRASLR